MARVKPDGTVESIPGWELGRTLIALQGGPFGNFWYWSDDFETLRARDEAEDRQNGKHHYQPTGRRLINPDPSLGGCSGEEWQWTPNRAAKSA